MSRMFVPGPVDVADEVLQAQAAPMLLTAARNLKPSFGAPLKNPSNFFIPNIASFSRPPLELDCRKPPFATLSISAFFPLSTARLRIAGTRSRSTMEKMWIELAFEWDMPASPDRIADTVKKADSKP